MPVVEACGCINDTDLNSGMDFCVCKCPSHIAYSKRPSSRGLQYYAKIKTVDKEGNPLPCNHVKEMKEALGPFPAELSLFNAEIALEIGGGTSPYVQALKSAGYTYLGIDADAWAAVWMMKTYDVDVICSKFPSATKGFCSDHFGLILAAHSMEHMLDAPNALREIYRLLKPKGVFYLLVPEGTDRTNPDHYWFFTAKTLQAFWNESDSPSRSSLSEASPR